MIRKLSVIALAVTVLVSGAVFADGIETTTEAFSDDWSYSFSEEKEFLDEFDIPSDDLVKLEKLFNEAVDLDKAGKFEESMVKWDAYSDILDQYLSGDDFEVDFDGEYTFEDEKEFLEEMGLKSEVIAELEVLFNKAIALEEAGKDDEADKVWESIENLFESNLPEGFNDYTFEEEKEFLEEMGLDSAVITELEVLFNKAIELEEADKDAEAEIVWEAYDNLLESNLPEDFDEEYTFEDEKEFLVEMGLDSAVIAELEVLFNKAIELEDAGKDDEADKVWEAIENLFEANLPEDFGGEYTFEDEKEFLEEMGLDSAVMTELEALFNKAIELEEAGKDDEADKVWEAYENLFESNLPEDFNEEYSFEDEKEFLEEMGLDSAVMTELEALFNKAIELEEAGKDAEAEKVWESIDNLLESNLPEGFDDFEDCDDGEGFDDFEDCDDGEDCDDFEDYDDEEDDDSVE